MTISNRPHDPELIRRQIASTIRRSNSLPADHPAQWGIHRTLDTLYLAEAPKGSSEE